VLSSCVALAAAAATAATAVATAEAEVAAEAAEECEAAAAAAEAAEVAGGVPGAEAAQAIEEDEGDRGHSNAPSVERAGEESAPIAHLGLGKLWWYFTRVTIKYIFTKSGAGRAPCRAHTRWNYAPALRLALLWPLPQIKRTLMSSHAQVKSPCQKHTHTVVKRKTGF